MAYSTSGTLVVSQTDSENLSDCLSDQGHSVATYRQIPCRNGYAHTACIRLKPSRRRSSSSKPHLIGCTICGVIRVDFQHPNQGDRTTGHELARRQRKYVCTENCSKTKWVLASFSIGEPLQPGTKVAETCCITLNRSPLFGKIKNTHDFTH